ncbi:hypothetical protein [Flagellimonas sp.]|uniref:hypothetical protein n=1 Tax=Flagellimonas sp. TaxID=2058762 RepID=UPI003B5B8A01
MDEKDELKNILNKLENVHPEIDLEQIILQKIEEQSAIKKQIATNKRYGFLGIAITLVLSMFFIWISNSPGLTAGVKSPLAQLVLCTFILLLFFFQLEAAPRFLNNKPKKEEQDIL